MPNTVVGVNPKLLRWAREQLALSLEEVASRLGKASTEIERWEEGASAPTYVQLETLAYEVYRRPIALFFFPEPPEEVQPSDEFRTLPEAATSNLQKDTRLAIREAAARQLSLREICDDRNPSERPLFREISVQPGHAWQAAATAVRKHLGITMEQQVSWRSAPVALSHWRDAVEKAGIFVFKRSLKQREISGFCLADAELPLIYVNNSSPKTRQIFTLMHELGHVLLASSGITFRDDRFIETLVGHAKNVEVFCNRFAAEALVPSGDFERYRNVQRWSENVVDDAAERYSVSREVILRRVLDWGYISQDYYRRKAREWTEQMTSRQKEGGDFYATQAAYLGDSYLTLVFSEHRRGRLSAEEMSEHLGMKTNTALKLEDYFLERLPPT